MKVTYYIVGFDRHTERAVRMLALPDDIVPAVKDIAGLTPEIAALWGDWPLTAEMVHQTGPLIGETLDAAGLEWFLEPTAELETARAAAQ